MASIINIALSGLSASGKQIEAIASNIANIKYEAPQVINKQSKLAESTQVTESASSASSIKAIAPTTTPVYDNNEINLAGANSSENDYAEQAVNLILARNSYKASVSTVQATNSVMASLLDIVE